jgi:hypothetical protein
MSEGRILFITGVHSCGKSYVLDSLTKNKCVGYYVWKRQEREELFTNKLYEDFASGQTRHDIVRERLLRRLEACEREYSLQQECLDQLDTVQYLITDRCPCDGLCYIHACFAARLINGDDYVMLLDSFDRMFKNYRSAWQGLYLQPSLVWLQGEFKKRNHAARCELFGFHKYFLKLSYEAFNDVYAGCTEEYSGNWKVSCQVECDDRRRAVLAMMNI